MEDKLTIAIDFDGTCVTHEYPNEGKDIGAIPVLKQLIAKGHELILYTMRSGAGLETAVQWFLRNDIRLYGIQYNPTQALWTSSNKCYAQLYIDDAALGCPLIHPSDVHAKEGLIASRYYVNSSRPYVDWYEVEKYLKQNNII
jgi:hypothetical protein